MLIPSLSPPTSRNPTVTLPGVNISLPLVASDETVLLLTRALASVNEDIAQLVADNSSNPLAALSMNPYSFVLVDSTQLSLIVASLVLDCLKLTSRHSSLISFICS
jgi:hypothetical protein